MMSNPKIDAKVGNLEKIWLVFFLSTTILETRSFYISFWGFLPEKMAEKMVGK